MVVQANKTIRVLNLRWNEIGDAGMLPLGDALKVDFVLFREISSFALLLLPVTQLSCPNGFSGQQNDQGVGFARQRNW